MVVLSPVGCTEVVCRNGTGTQEDWSLTVSTPVGCTTGAEPLSVFIASGFRQ